MSILREEGVWPWRTFTKSTGKRVPLKGQVGSLMLDFKRCQEQKKFVLIYLTV